MSCRTSSCCDPNPFAYRADAAAVEDTTVACATTNPQCADPVYRATHLEECTDDDVRCSDPEFAAANPMLCLSTPRLLLKPSSAVVEVLADAQYRAFLWINGAETELLSGVIYSTDDTTIALIGSGSGNATGISAGITTVRAAYGGLTATAQIEVIADCAVRQNHFLFLFDVSRTTENPFGGAYTDLLDVAQYLGRDFADNCDLSKDEAAVMQFDTAASEVQAFTQTVGLLDTAIDGLTSTTSNTDIAQALTDANQYFTDEGIAASGRVIILFTDGRNNTGVDPIPISDTIRASGTIILVVGLRARGGSFHMLERIASGGFFINAKTDNIASVADWVNGLRSYLCSGNCTPCGDVTVGVGHLNYTGWTNWNVTSGTVDLIGKNAGGTPLYDVRPGNGLYMDDHGSSAVYDGEVTSKTAFTLVVGQEYKLSVSIAGHNRSDSAVPTRDTQVTFGAYVNDTVTRNYTDDFILEEWTFTATAADVLNIVIAGKTTLGEQAFGNLIGYVKFENLTTATVLLEDDFDDENLTYIPVGCCEGYGGYSGCYGSGCLDSPIPGQTQDTTALPDLEATS